MKKTIFTMAAISALAFAGCSRSANTGGSEMTTPESTGSGSSSMSTNDSTTTMPDAVYGSNKVPAAAYTNSGVSGTGATLPQ